MRSRELLTRSLRHYWRTNLAVVIGVATAVTVLGGALLVGDSVRGSLRDLVLQRLGNTDFVVSSPEFFTPTVAQMANDAEFQQQFSGLAQLITLPGIATNQETGRRAGRVMVYGVDDAFWKFHGVSPVGSESPHSISEREVLLSEPLAREIGATEGTTVLLRIQRPSDIPLESLHGRKDDVGRTVRLTVRGILSGSQLGEFSLQPQQGDVRAAFMTIRRLQTESGATIAAGSESPIPGANTLLVSRREGHNGDDRGRLEGLVRRHARLVDVGLSVRSLSASRDDATLPPTLSVEANGTLIDEPREQAILQAARALKLSATPVLTYLVNGMRAGDRTTPYSLVTAIELTTLIPDLVSNDARLPPIVLNEWAARDLAVKPGERVTLDYFIWEEPGRLTTKSSSFELAAVVPMTGPAADRSFSPHYPGITDTDTLRDWDPPFPIDLRRIRDVDEAYWEQYRTTPKAFVPESFGRAFWGSRYGQATSIRIAAGPGIEKFEQQLRSGIDPVALGIAVRDVRSEALTASRGATNFGEYFTYFSFFLVVSALLLTALFFKLGVEQRVREIGLLRAVGFSTAVVRRLFAAEGLLLAAVGSVIGVLGALGYAQLLMVGLRTWWVDAVGTTGLTLHVTPISLAAGGIGGIVAALACIWWTLRSLSRVSERALLAGEIGDDAKFTIYNSKSEMPDTGRGRRLVNSKFLIVNFVSVSLLLLLLSSVGMIADSVAFFGAGALLLAAALAAAAFWLGRPPRSTLSGHGWWSLSRLGIRNASYRPARSVVSIAVMAAATFILISVGAFRRDGTIDWSDPNSGTGGYPLVVETLLPIAVDPNSDDGRAQLGLPSGDVSVEPFRLLPGDDASCLNLYAPQQPRILGVKREFVAKDRFAFAATLDGAERENPWRLLEREEDDGTIPVIGDANSMTYVLHKAIGDEIVVDRGGRQIRMKLVATLADSIFQSELLMSEANFLAHFPDQEGYGVMLVSAPATEVAAVSAAIEQNLTDHGADAVSTADRLAEFHRVENTYLSTFQTLGGLGLLLGTVGLAAVLLRNVLERRRELALLGAVGYRRGGLLMIVVSESALLLLCGLAAGIICALIATAPAAAARGGRLPVAASGWILLFAVFATGLISSIVATRAAVASRLLDALRAE
jgi:ABC-type antimicrobial peptide transport system permease subunit